jgi:hypothetical protein
MCENPYVLVENPYVSLLDLNSAIRGISRILTSGVIWQVRQHERLLDLGHRRNHRRKILKVDFFSLHMLKVTQYVSIIRVIERLSVYVTRYFYSSNVFNATTVILLNLNV